MTVKPLQALWFFGFVFLALAAIDVFMKKTDAITSVFLFFGCLTFAVAHCLKEIVQRLTSIEKSLQELQKEKSKNTLS